MLIRLGNCNFSDNQTAIPQPSSYAIVSFYYHLDESGLQVDQCFYLLPRVEILDFL